ncbi:hypothetical protein ACEWPM_004230 [Roseovarius sp. S4756]|uniref:hypothetical protein n=1 Tax=Roseovarius maritimus TaxID=3342637 RepID=UPI00372B49DD
MGAPSILRKIGQALEARSDRVFVERRNRKLETAYARDRKAWLQRMEVALVRGRRWFEPQHDLTMSAILVLDQAFRQSGHDDLAFVEDRIEIYRQTYFDPGLRAVRRDYDPDQHRHLPDIMEIRRYQVIELMMIDAANADRIDAKRLLRYLQALPDGGHYGSTHVVVGGLLMKRAGVELEGQIDSLIEAEIASIAARNSEVSYAGDLFAERIFILEWFGRHDLVSPAWMIRLTRAQQKDGGWLGRSVPPFGRSNQHTTSLAMAALAQFLHAERIRCAGRNE